MSIAFGVFPFVISTPIYVRISAGFFLFAAPIFLFAIIFPKKCLRGIRMFDDGFEYCLQFSTAKIMRFEDITFIEAVGFEAPETGEKDFLLWIYTSCQKVSVVERDLYRTGLLDKLEKFPGFNQSAISAAVNFQPKWRDRFNKKRFVVFSR